MNINPKNWHEQSHARLESELDRIRQLLEEQVQGQEAASDEQPVLTDDSVETPEAVALDVLCSVFKLSAFERDILLLCAGCEMDSRFPRLCASIQGNDGSPTFGLALSTFTGSHWDALTPVGPLRHWRLIEVSQGNGLAGSRLRIDERILHHLVGLAYLDDRLKPYMRPSSRTTTLSPSQLRHAERIHSLWQGADHTASIPITQLCMGGSTLLEAVALNACETDRARLFVLHACDIPGSPAERETLAQLWMRECRLGRLALLIEVRENDSPETHKNVSLFLERVSGRVMISTPTPVVLTQRQDIKLEIGKPTGAEQRQIWRRVLGNAGNRLNGQVDSIVMQFNLDSHDIEHAGESFLEKRPEDPQELVRELWSTCKEHSRQRLEHLAQRIEPRTVMDDLILPELQMDTIRAIAVHVRQRMKVYGEWGFASRFSRGLGISALFAGSSGTGKTFAAEALARELDLDLYRIDLSSVVNKYVGETEKNLRRVFEAAENSGAILLFDEADALFGKRSEVKDSHDRLANIEVSYLLQRIETYRGLAILTTNMKDALDAAFLRRIRFMVHFPFPDFEHRVKIWGRIFPESAETLGLDFQKLARLNVAGGNIRNIALNAAFYAAEEGHPVGMNHLLSAARAEYAKLERSLTPAETGKWL